MNQRSGSIWAEKVVENLGPYESYRTSLSGKSYAWPDEAMLRDTACLVADGQDLAEALDILSRHLGFTYFSCVVGYLPPNGQSGAKTLMISNYPDDWQQHYTRENYSDADPIVGFARRARVPFLWGRDEDLMKLDPPRQKLMEESRSFGIRLGISVPTHGPRGEFTLLSMISKDGIHSMQALVQQSYNLLWMLSPMVHTTAVTCYLPPDDQNNVSLSDHERICLRWTLQGKTSWEISRIISRSRPTVEYHLQKAMRKFGVTTKIQAAAEALKRGML
jgi:DNA-binding CsgD family transcriptional regulator